MPSGPVIIAAYARTPIGAFQGGLAGAGATGLGAAAVREAVHRSGAAPEAVDRLYMGCVLPAGLGQAPARQATLRAGVWPSPVEATTANKMCGSGMQAMIAAVEADTDEQPGRAKPAKIPSLKPAFFKDGTI